MRKILNRKFFDPDPTAGSSGGGEATGAPTTTTTTTTPSELEFDLGNGQKWSATHDKVQEVLRQANPAFGLIEQLKTKGILNEKYEIVEPKKEAEEQTTPTEDDRVTKLEAELSAIKNQTNTDKFLGNVTKTMEISGSKFEITKSNETAKGLVESLVLAQAFMDGPKLNTSLAYESAAKSVQKIVDAEVKRILESKAKQAANPGDTSGGNEIFKMEKPLSGDDMKSGKVAEVLRASLAKLLG